MAKDSSFITLAAVELDKSSDRPLYRQLYDQLREAILSRRLVGGLRLPPTRALADELSVSRNTVVNAFEQLMAEGYITGKVGSGTYVAPALPAEALALRARNKRAARPSPATRSLSQRGAVIAATAMQSLPDAGKPRPFRPGLPALDAFPLDIWARLHARHWRSTGGELLGYGHAAGYWPLRQAIASYLGASRGVQCDAEQVIMVAGSQQAIDLAARLLLDPNDAVWIEDPGYLGARGALTGAGARLVPVPIDAEGIELRVGVARAPDARMVYVSPSHQFPLGVTMSLHRRLALLEWASRSGAWILEDDY
ncbi:MAG: PLP-dependent aminotransferase family protein, partial [Chloroflexota bacterium]